MMATFIPPPVVPATITTPGIVKVGQNLTVTTDGTISVADAAAASRFTFTQNTPLATWHIVHNLGRFPSITVTDSTGRIVEGDIQFVNPNEVDVSFSAAFSGDAYLN